MPATTMLPLPRAEPSLALLRLLQMADSGFPVGAFAYSHGLETLVADGRLASEKQLAQLLAQFVSQPLRGQALPACLAAWRATSAERLAWLDERLDASISLPSERQSSRAMGRRLLDLAPELESRLADDPYRRAVLSGAALGHHPTAFGSIARQLAIPAPQTLAAFGLGAVQSLTSASTRLGFIGPAAAVRLLAGAGPSLAAALEAVLDEPPAARFGSWLPLLEIGAARHPNLPFRMFAT